MQIELAQSARDLTELFKEPALTVACVLLIVASVGWIVVSRLIVRQVTRAAMRTRAVPLDLVRPPKDIWSLPPPPHPHASLIADEELVVAVDHMYVYDFSGDGGGAGTDGGGTAEVTSVIRLDEPERAL